MFFALWLPLLFLEVTLDSSGILRLALRFIGVPVLPLKTNGSRGITHLLVPITVLFREGVLLFCVADGTSMEKPKKLYKVK